ncbi:MAG: shikimate dehydrogenase [Deltaproteobacteria bacterium]|nr:shikimate dehydrogenase [Deltaproteobacteria bacterium]MBW2120443.1 shikimate dehydrogenase [Deltaproteobacteria bacterium]
MKVFCILGDERAFRSKSPVIFSAVLKRVGIKGVYVPFKVDPDQLGQAVRSLRALNISGANVTVPYKEKVIPHLDALSEGATLIGAVNTVVRNGGILKGYNTNAIGFMDALDHAGFDVAGKSALVFGAGGAAKAVVFILNWLRAESILIAARREEKAAEIVNRIGGESKPMAALLDGPVAAHIVVNATPVSSPDESAELAALVAGLDIPGCELVLDLNYGRPRNLWQELALSRNIPFMDGRHALAFQAKRSFALWTGIQVEPEEFLRAMGEA